jgi:hypothetical protein
MSAISQTLFEYQFINYEDSRDILIKVYNLEKHQVKSIKFVKLLTI